MLNRITLIIAVAAAAALPALAQDGSYPAQPIHLIVPYAAGGPVDFSGRNAAFALGEALPQPVVVENLAGAGGTTGTESVIASAPDGYRLLVGSFGPMIISPLSGRVSYDPATALEPVALISQSTQMLAVHPDVDAQDMAGFVALARAEPDTVTVGSAGVGTSNHLAIELIGREAGVQLVHVPYRGTAAAIPDVLSGAIDAVVGDVSVLMPLVEDGRLRAIAVTSPDRSPVAPDVVTMGEAGYPAIQSQNWTGLFAPAGTDPEAIQMLAQVLAEAAATEEYAQMFLSQGAVVPVSSPEHMAEFLATELATWAPVVSELDLE